MSDDDYGGSDILSEKDVQEIEKNHEGILNELHAKVRDSDEARKWLDTPLGTSFRKFLAADKLRTMRRCSKETDPEKLKSAQIDYAAVCKLEVIFGSILADGNEALQQLTQLHEGDTHGD